MQDHDHACDCAVQVSFFFSSKCAAPCAAVLVEIRHMVVHFANQARAQKAFGGSKRDQDSVSEKKFATNDVPETDFDELVDPISVGHSQKPMLRQLAMKFFVVDKQKETEK